MKEKGFYWENREWGTPTKLFFKKDKGKKKKGGCGRKEKEEGKGVKGGEKRQWFCWAGGAAVGDGGGCKKRVKVRKRKELLEITERTS